MKMDLGKTPDSDSMAMPASPASTEPTTHYPSLYIDGDAKDLAGLPDSGSMTVTFKKTSHTTRTDQKSGESSASVHLDIISIDDVEPDDDEDSQSQDPGDALDAAAAAEKADSEDKEQ